MNFIKFQNQVLMGLKNNCILLFILFLVNFGLFLPYFNNGLCVDDISFLSKENPYFQSLTSYSDFFTKTIGQHYNPLYYLANFLLFHSFPHHPSAMRVFNLILHVVSCFLIYLLLKKTGIKNRAAFGAVLLFSIHPLNAENILHVSQNFVLFTSVAMSLSLLCFLDIKNHPANSTAHTFGSCLFFMTALLFSEFALVLPAYFLMICLLLDRLTLRQSLQKIWPWLSMSMVFFIIWVKTGQQNLGFFQNINSLAISVTQYLAGIYSLGMWYLSNLFYPRSPVIIYSISQKQLLFGSWWLMGISLCIGLFVFIRLKQNTFEYFYFIWFVVGLMPFFLTTFVHSYMGLVIEPHWFYYASIGFFVILVLRLENWTNKIPGLFNIIMIFICIYLIGFTFVQGNHWKDNLTYGEYWLKANPQNNIALNIVADEYTKRQEYEKALGYYQKLLDNVHYYQAYKVHNYMAFIYDKTDRVDLAKKHLYLSLADNPSYAETYNILGSIEAANGNFINAKENFLKALKISPYDAAIGANLAQVYIILKDFKSAQLILDSFEGPAKSVQ